jgi:hypothetical protein
MSRKSLTEEECSQKIYDDAYLESEEYVATLGLGRRPRPKYDGVHYSGQLPDGISKASLSEIEVEMEKIIAFQAYVQQLAVDAKNQLTNAENKLKDTKADIKKRQVGNKEDRDSSTIRHPKFVSANAEFLTKLYTYEKISVAVQTASQSYKLLSRLVSVAQINDENGKRVGNVKKSLSSKRWR